MREEREVDALLRICQLMFLHQISQAYQLIYLSFIIWKYEPEYLMFLCWLIDIFAITGLGIVKTKFKIIINHLILDIGVGSVYKLLILIKIKYYQNFQVQYFAYAIMAYYFFRAIIKNIRKISNNEPISQYSFIVQGIKLILVLQLMMITMKLSQALSWNWYSVFSLVWGLLIITFIVHFIFVLSLGETLIDFVRSHASQAQLLGGIWFTLFLSAFSVFPLWFFFEVCSGLEQNVNQSPTFLFLTMATYNVVIYLTLLFGYGQIKLFVLDIKFSATAKKSQQPQTDKKVIKVNIPFQIIQLSSTYFEIVKTDKNLVTIQHSSQSVLHQKAKLKAFEFIGKTEHRQLPSPSGEGDLDIMRSQGEKCQICFESDPNIVMLPCQHGGLCEECILKWLEKSKQCYLCREKIDKYLKIGQCEGEGKFAINDIAICD